jgi:hypothetical protein
LALEDSEFGDATAELIGHLRPAAAVRFVLNHADDERKITALLLIQRVAGSLPAFVPGDIRFKLSVEWIISRLLLKPVSLVGAYMFAFLGAALGIGLQVYLTYNLPDFMDAARITTSLEQGLIIGTIFGLGIFIVRVIMERFQTSAALVRVFIATIAGGIGINIALLIFHVLFLNTSPKGFLISAACALIALTFAIGGVIRSRLFRMILSSVSVFVAIMGTWWLHAHYAVSIMDLTPVFRYDYAWTLRQVGLTVLSVALPIGIFGNLVNLSIVDE